MEPSSCSCGYTQPPPLKCILFPKVGDGDIARRSAGPLASARPSAAALTNSADSGGEKPTSYSPRHIPSYQRVVSHPRQPPARPPRAAAWLCCTGGQTAALNSNSHMTLLKGGGWNNKHLAHLAQIWWCVCVCVWGVGGVSEAERPTLSGTKETWWGGWLGGCCSKPSAGGSGFPSLSLCAVIDDRWARISLYHLLCSHMF